MADTKKFVWFTDTHLNFTSPWTIRKFVSDLIVEQPEGLFLTGDISDGWRLKHHLEYIASRVNFPVYFVLGNHDYYGYSIAEIHEQVRDVCARYPHMKWMSEQTDVITLSTKVGLIGTEGWYDAAYGNQLLLGYTWDWFLIRDFSKLTSWPDRIKAFKKLSEASDRKLRIALENAFVNHDKVYVLTHFPPWIEASGVTGTFFEDLYAGYNVNKRMGTGIELVSALNPDKKITVLCGHTHDESRIKITSNIKVRVNKARYYGRPGFERYIYI